MWDARLVREKSTQGQRDYLRLDLHAYVHPENQKNMISFLLVKNIFNN